MHDLNYCMPDLNYCMPDLNYCGITAELLRNYCGITAELLRNYCGITVKQAELLYARKNSPWRRRETMLKRFPEFFFGWIRKVFQVFTSLDQRAQLSLLKSDKR